MSEARWRRVGLGLTEGDPLADEVARWLSATDPRRAWGLVDRGLRGGLASIDRSERGGAEALVALLEKVEAPPPWLDRDLLTLGGRVLDRAHPVPYYVLRNMGLLAGYAWRDLNRPLVMTGALHGGAARRVAQTMKWTADCMTPSGLERGGPGYLSTLHVRLLHARVRADLAQRDDWDTDELGLPINQTDMAATWLAFSVVFLAGARALGVSFTPTEARGVMHLWAVACRQMGVDDHWLTDDEHDGRRLLFEILSTYRGPDETSRALAQALQREPFQLPYPAPRSLHQHLERAKHLSVASLVLGPRGLRELGLPATALPWYPALVAPWNAVRSRVLQRAPSLARAAEAQGRSRRDALVALHLHGTASRPEAPG